MLSKDLMKISMRDCTQKVDVLPDQRKTNNNTTKKNKTKKRKNVISDNILSIEKKYKQMRDEKKKDV